MTVPTGYSKANLGSGTTAQRQFPPPWLNVDLMEGADYQCDIRRLPEDWTGDLDEVRASHVLEHLFLDEWDAALAGWARLLRPGGILRVIVPDLDVVVRDLASGTDQAGLPATSLTSETNPLIQLYGEGYTTRDTDERWRHRIIADRRMLTGVIARVPELDEVRCYHWSEDPAAALGVEDDSQSAYSLCVMATRK